MKDFEPGVWLSLEIHLYAALSYFSTTIAYHFTKISHFTFHNNGIHINAERESKELSVYLNEWILYSKSWSKYRLIKTGLENKI